MFGIGWYDKMTPEKRALVDAMLHLRMHMLGHTSYSASPSRIDKGYAELVIDRLEGSGYRLVKADADPGIPILRSRDATADVLGEEGSLREAIQIGGGEPPKP